MQGSFIINTGTTPKEITKATYQEKPKKLKNPNVLFHKKGLSIIKVGHKSNALIKKRGLSIIPLGKKINKNFDDIFSGIFHVLSSNFLTFTIS